MTRAFLVALFLVAGNPFSVPTARQAPLKIAYDTFCKLPDVDAKREAFINTSAENRAELVRTHVERWRDANRARLTAAQISLLDDFIKNITAQTYSDTPAGEEARAKLRPAVERQRELFTSADIQAMQPNAPCIAKGK